MNLFRRLFSPPGTPKPTAEPLRHNAPEDPKGGNDDRWPIGKLLLGEYSVDGYLGEGGMGIVYLVNGKTLGQQSYAVKTVRRSPNLSEFDHIRLIRELRTWTDLPPSPYFVPCRFFRTIDGRLAIFADYIPGGSLQKWISEGRFHRLDEILSVAIQVAEALHEAHQHGIVHQDVKSSNILMSIDGQAKLTDFGLANVLKSANPEMNHLSRRSSPLNLGTGMTPAYCSPEQATRAAITHKTDIWSWGLLVLELFVGEVAWSDGTLARNILNGYRGEQPLPLSVALPKPVAEILEKCFQENPDDRWNSFADVTAYLRVRK